MKLLYKMKYIKNKASLFNKKYQLYKKKYILYHNFNKYNSKLYI